MTISIFNYLDYKIFILDTVTSLGEPWGYWGKLAKAISCQPAYLSRCLKDKTNLTVDQVLALCRFWSLSSSETEYLIYLLELARAATNENKKYFLSKINILKQENENLKNIVKRESLINVHDQSTYYSSWLWMALHFATSIEELQTIDSLAERFYLPKSQLQNILEKLAFLGLIIKSGNRWIFKTGEYHLEKNSPLIPAHHQNWRNRATIDSQNSNTDGIHYSAVYTLSEKDFQILKDNILKWIKVSNDVVKNSKEEEIVCFNLDFFRI